MVPGLSDLVQAMEEIRRNFPTRDANSAIRAGLKTLATAAKQATPVGPTGNLKRAIRHKLRKIRGQKEPSGKVGMNVGRKVVKSKSIQNRQNLNYAPHAHLVALGTKQRFTKAGRNRGVMPSNNFFKRVVESHLSSAIRDIEFKLNERLQTRHKK